MPVPASPQPRDPTYDAAEALKSGKPLRLALYVFGLARARRRVTGHSQAPCRARRRAAALRSRALLSPSRHVRRLSPGRVSRLQSVRQPRAQADVALAVDSRQARLVRLHGQEELARDLATRTRSPRSASSSRHAHSRTPTRSSRPWPRTFPSPRSQAGAGTTPTPRPTWCSSTAASSPAATSTTPPLA